MPYGWVRMGRQLQMCGLATALLVAGVARGQEASLVEEHAGGRISKPKPVYAFNDQVYYRNRLEYSLETGYLWINIPFVYDVFVGGDYSQRDYHYTLVPIFPSIRWQTGKIRGPLFLRGNTEITASINVTAIPRGYENVYGAFDLGFRRNFVYRDWKLSPYFEAGAGAGFIDAKQYLGHEPYAQGQDYTFTLTLGAGVRYNINPRYSVSLGGRYMHVSNLFESEPRYIDNGINVVGPWVGIYMRAGKGRKVK